MAGFGYVCALALAAVFIRAGAAKLARRDQTAESFKALGLPAAHPLALTVPLLELALAVALVAVPRAGGIASLVVLALFTAVVVRAIASGVTASCNCFGAARAEPVSRKDVVRNLVLAGLAVAAALSSAPF
ncbi:MAG: DoxX family membrane protein [Actinomycetota bacterium]|nr:DoxX family membrane protein [Actinomycetota bacterium]